MTSEPDGAEPHELAALYALDALDVPERERFQGHLAECPACQDEVARLRTSTTALAELASGPVPPDLRQRVLSEITRTPQVTRSGRSAPGADPTGPAPLSSLEAGRARREHRRGGTGSGRSGRGRFLGAVAAAVLALAGTLGAVAVLVRDREGSTSEVAALRASADARSVTLAGDTGTVEVVWSLSQDGVAVVATGLADPGPDRTYQLWRIEGDGVVPSGLFQPDGSGSAEAVVALLDGDPAGWGVTIEPEAGSPQPTSDILYQAQV
jgi:anti-sigma factor RsiW